MNFHEQKKKAQGVQVMYGMNWQKENRRLASAYDLQLREDLLSQSILIGILKKIISQAEVTEIM